MTWFVMRDLTRPNALHPAWTVLQAEGFRVFTPMKWSLRRRNGKSVKVRVPVIHDLLFVDTSREELDPIVRRISTLQYRFKRGGKLGEAIVVNHAEMERFIKAVDSSDDIVYYSPSELTSSMLGKKVKIVGGPLNGMSGHLLSVRGMRKRRLIVELAGMLASAVEVSPDYIEIVDNDDV